MVVKLYYISESPRKLIEQKLLGLPQSLWLTTSGVGHKKLISNMLFGDVASLGLHCETLFNGLR
jgi:hypothetical protein